jgi:seryl-tRNA synthetase
VRLTVELAGQAHEMAQEEITKQVAYLSPDIRNVRFNGEGTILECDVPDAQAERLAQDVRALADRMLRSLRRLQRKVIFRSALFDRPVFRGSDSIDDVYVLGTGQVALTGLPLALFTYFDRLFTELGRPWAAKAVRTPTLIPAQALARCDYFRSFPQNVTFASHLREDLEVIDGFRARHDTLDRLDDRALADMATPEVCLSPAVCYHIYHLHQNQTIPRGGTAHGVCGSCFRYEAGNTSDLRRLWDFTMREVVFMGTREDVLQRRDTAIQKVADLLDQHRLAGEIRTASDPFFVAPDAAAKTYFQLSSETKYEISLLLPASERVAVGSLNYHTDFFGRAFAINVDGHGPMHSVCVAFGLERWVHAFLAQHGQHPDDWPAIVRDAPEFASTVSAAC